MHSVIEILRNPSSLFVVTVLLATTILVFRNRSPRKFIFFFIVLVLVIQVTALVGYGRQQGVELQNFLGQHSSDLWQLRMVRTATAMAVNWAFTAGVGLVLWGLFVKRGRSQIMDQNDVLLFTLGGLITGWPAGLLFLGMTFVLAIVWMVALVILKKKTMADRLVVTPVIAPAALITLLFSPILLQWTGLFVIRV